MKLAIPYKPMGAVAVLLFVLWCAKQGIAKRLGRA